MVEKFNGKLLVYASNLVSRDNRLRHVRVATQRMAKLLNLNLEVVTFQKKFTTIYVYYKSRESEPIPIYRDSTRQPCVDEVYTAMRNMMFVLSFHPKHSALRQVRNEVMRFS